MTTLAQRLKETAAGVSVSLAIASSDEPARAEVNEAAVAAVHAPMRQQAPKPPAAYADGTYVARGWYHGRSSSMTVTLTLSSDIITAVEVRPHATDPASLEVQRRFAASVPNAVVGKRVAQVRVGRSKGSGGTTEGFNDAVRSIKEVADTRLTRTPIRAPEVPPSRRT